MDSENGKMKNKPAMAAKYPHQIWAAPRERGAVTCAEKLAAPKEDDTKNAPLEMHSGYSVFNIAIALKEGSVVANIPASDIPCLLEEYRFQRDALHKYSMQRPKGKAYTAVIPDRNCQNKTPVEVLQMADGLQKLKNARDLMEKNLARYPKNKEKIDAIDEALVLHQEGKLKASGYSLPSLYHKDFKHKASRNKNGFPLVYFIDISGVAEDVVTWTFSITNCYAPIKSGVMPDMERAVDKRSYSFKVTQEEMDLFIFRIRATMEHFEAMMFRNQYAAAKKYEWKAEDKAM